MLIDWFTVGAQALNFIILVWLMKRFLYQPVLRAIDAREKRVATELINAANKKTEAEKEQFEFRRRNESFDRQRDNFLKKAIDEANSERQRLLDEARKDAELLIIKQQADLKNTAAKLDEEISRRVQDEVFAIARKLLRDLSGIDLEVRMYEMFIERLRTLDQDTKKIIISSFANTSEPIRIRSAFPLSEAQCKKITQIVSDIFNEPLTNIQIGFDIAPDLIGGIELDSGGQKVALSIDAHLNLLESKVKEILNNPEKFGFKSEKVHKPSIHSSDLIGVKTHAE